MRHYRSTVAILAFLSLVGSGAMASKINTGGQSGAYHNQFCKLLKKGLDKAHFDYECNTSKGSVNNLDRVRRDPSQIGFSQFDVYALEVSQNVRSNPYQLVRSDIARECLFMVTKNIDLENFGQVSALAEDIHFILPPQGSGSVATFEFLKTIDPDGLRFAQNITYAKSTKEALEMALKTDDGSVALFVQFPDPNNERFKAVNKLGGHFIPVIDRNILRQQVGGKKIYFAQETGVSNPKLWKKGTRVVTACTPLVVFTGNPEQLPSGQGKLDQEDMIQTISAMPRENLLPKKGYLSSFWEKTKSLSADGIDKLLVVTEKAREAAAPALEKAKKMGKSAMDKAKDKARKMREDAAERAADRALRDSER